MIPQLCAQSGTKSWRGTFDRAAIDDEIAKLTNCDDHNDGAHLRIVPKLSCKREVYLTSESFLTNLLMAE
jgi:hypothetical protein